MAKRHFTRAEVEARFNQIWGEDTEMQKWYAKEIRFIPGLNPPTWMIEFYADTYEDGMRVNHYHDIVLLIQRKDFHGHPVLRTSNDIVLPVGCVNPREEDKEIERVRRERDQKSQEASNSN